MGRLTDWFRLCNVVKGGVLFDIFGVPVYV